MEKSREPRVEVYNTCYKMQRVIWHFYRYTVYRYMLRRRELIRTLRFENIKEGENEKWTALRGRERRRGKK